MLFRSVSGFAAEREIPVVLAVARGSLVNKAILVPAALLISAWLPWLVTPLLMVGGLYLCFEGVEKLAHAWLHSAEEDASHHAELQAHVADTTTDLATLEADKVRGAIRTDFILSAEIITIALGTIAGQPLLTQVLVLSGVALLMTVGVYGLVAGIVKLDDLGLHWTRQPSALLQRLGRGLLAFAPRLLKGLAVVGTAAMFLVGGGILVHGWPAWHHAALAVAPWLDSAWTGWLLDMATGVLGGAVVLALVQGVQRLRR